MGLTEYGHIATEETQLRVADLLQAIAAGSAGPEYTDATFKALLDDTNTTEIFSAWWPLSAASNDSKYKRLLRFFTMLQTDKTYTVKFPSPAVSTNPAGTPGGRSCGKERGSLGNRQHKPGRLGGGRPHDLVYSRQRCEPGGRNYGRSCR